jgi:hypothetical protein
LQRHEVNRYDDTRGYVTTTQSWKDSVRDLAYLRSKGNVDRMSYPLDRWMRRLSEIAMLLLLYALLSDHPVSRATKFLFVILAWTIWRSTYKLMQLIYSKSSKFEKRRATTD